MKPYTYKFVDGTTSTVMVEDDLYDLLVEMDRQEKCGNRRETRRHISLEKLVEQNVEIPVMDEYFAGDIFGAIQDDKLRAGLDSLTESQRDLVVAAIVDEIPQKVLAERNGTVKQAINNRIDRILKKVRRFFQ